MDPTIPQDASPIPATTSEMPPYKVYNRGRDVRVETRKRTLWSIRKNLAGGKLVGYEGFAMKPNDDKTEEIYGFRIMEGEKRAGVWYLHQGIKIPVRDAFLDELRSFDGFSLVNLDQVEKTDPDYNVGDNWNILVREIAEGAQMSGGGVDPYNKPFIDVGLDNFRASLSAKCRASKRNF